jgi:transposase-like protein
MKERKRMTLAEMAAQATPRVNGRLICPNCGCSDFKAGKVRRAGSSVFRYRKCAHCDRSYMTSQAEERIVRPVEISSDEFVSDELEMDSPMADQ